MKRTNLLARAGLVLLALAVGACSSTRTQQSAGEVIDDTTLTTKVKTALIQDPVTQARQIDVETYRGVVQLGGFVDSAEQKARATELAQSVTGVKEVRNDLRVADADQSTLGDKVDDTVIATQVKTKLIADPRTGALQINVKTDGGGVVQLMGFVSDGEEKRVAEEIARSVEGVSSVKNDLQIRQND